ncbi:MAG TPA: shikimate dehydrogenase [Clostridiaceae bacterium]|nr:shikimate dehydrogenase [Clostridiaceae bacterium]
MNKKNIIKSGIIGYPLNYSISPDIHNYLYEQAGIQGVYKEFRIRPEVFAERIDAILKEYQYLNVTIPYKKDIISHLQGTSDSARILGVVNTVACELGYNTDGMGLELALAEWPKPDHAMIIGAGNTSRTALYTLLDLEIPNISLIHRNANTLNKLKQEFAEVIKVKVLSARSFASIATDQQISFLDNPEEIFGFDQKIDLLINTTSAGMYPEIDQIPLPEEIIQHILIESKPRVFDVVYNPIRTKLLKMATERELEIKNGLSMLFYQAYASQSIWLDKQYSVEKAEKLWKSFVEKFNPEKFIVENWSVKKI